MRRGVILHLGDDAWAGYAASLAEGGDAEAFTAALRADLLGEDAERDEQAAEREEPAINDDDQQEGQGGKRQSRSWWPWPRWLWRLPGSTWWWQP